MINKQNKEGSETSKKNSKTTNNQLEENTRNGEKKTTEHCRCQLTSPTSLTIASLKTKRQPTKSTTNANKFSNSPYQCKAAASVDIDSIPTERRKASIRRNNKKNVPKTTNRNHNRRSTINNQSAKIQKTTINQKPKNNNKPKIRIRKQDGSIRKKKNEPSRRKMKKSRKVRTELKWN